MTDALWWLLLPLATLALTIGHNLGSARLSAPRAAGFAGAGELAAVRSPVRLRTVAGGCGAAVLILVLVAVFAPPATAAVAGAATLGVGGLTVVLARHRSRVRRTFTAIDEHAPRLAICYAGKSGLHVGMWSPWFEQAKIPWCVTVPSDDQFDKIRTHYPDFAVVAGDLPASVKSAFYPHGGGANRRYLDARPDVTHVFLGHGDSDKPLSASDRVLDFDLVAVAGQAALDRFDAAGVELGDRVRVIGRPQTEGIVQVSDPIPTPATVLYAPTLWHQDPSANVSSLPVARTLIEELLSRGCTIAFRRHFARIQHPDAEDTIAWIDERLAEDAKATGRAHRYGLEPRLVSIPELFNAVDAVVSDVSSIVVDFMASDKPYLMYAAQYDDVEAFRAAHPSAVGAYAVPRDLTGLSEQLDQLLGDDPLAELRHSRADYFLGGPERRDPAARFLALLHELDATS
ncbi:MAG TPA: CDP-glycerol glycerophosphotransferase family protein [Aeromicrobium sp.]|nr:CDP-glycerol glycerophosphotransferase family protein [Aeromicrobium sp.]